MVNLLLCILQNVVLFVNGILRVLRSGINFMKILGWSVSVKLEFQGDEDGFYANLVNEKDIDLNLS